MLEVRLLGQFDVRFDGEPIKVHSRPAQSLLAYLVLNAGISHRRERLAGLLWPDSAEANARSYLRQTLWRIRKALTAYPLPLRDYLQTDDISISFDEQSDYWLDAASVLMRNKSWSEEELIKIVSVYRGELLPGFYDEWVYLERERLRAAFENKMKLLLEALLNAGHFDDVLHWGEHWISLGYVPETAYRALMVAQVAMGDTSSAAAIYNRCVKNLNRELGVEPSRETQVVYETILTRSEKEAKATIKDLGSHFFVPFVIGRRLDLVEEREDTDEPPAPGEPPFKGLQFFDQADADIFFGREMLTASLVKHIREGHRFIVIVGASGSGKSSVVRAGLVPVLQRGETLADGEYPPKGSEDWLIHVITPTAHPLESLTTSLTRDHESVTVTSTLMDDLARDTRSLHMTIERMAEAQDTTRLLLVVDQFEELFTLCRDEVERKAFIDNLLTATVSEAKGPTTVVITLRADFYERCSEYENLRQALAKHQEYIGPMTAREMRRAIEEPAKQGGWDFQSGMVDLFLRDVRGEPGALPLLSHALLETWLRRSGRMLTLKGYAASGGVPGAIARTAEMVFNRHLTEEQQAIARKIFLRLTELGEGTQDTRRRVALSELIPHPDTAAAVEEVIKKLADARLITTYEDTAEVAHEALIREWPALREWLDEDREGLKLHRHLTESAQEWEELDRDSGELYRGARLVQVLEWAAENEGQLNELEREFLGASQIFALDEEAERQAQQQRELEAARKLAEAEKKRAAEQTKSVRRLRRLAMGLGVVLLIAVVVAGIAMQQRKQIENEAYLRASRELAVAAISNLHQDPELSILLALEAVREAESAGLPVPLETGNALHRAVHALPLKLVLQGHADGVVSIAFSPDGIRLATASRDGTARVWDAGTGEEIFTFTRHTGVVTGVAFSPDGMRLATSSHDHTAKVWDSATGQELLTFSGHNDWIEDIAFSPDGSRLITASRDGAAKIWDSTMGEELLTLAGHTAVITGVEFSTDGRRVATASMDGTAKVWDASSGDELLILSGDPVGVRKVTFSPDGTRLAITNPGGYVTVWDAFTGEELLTSIPINGEIMDVAFSPDGTHMATAGVGGYANVCDAETGDELLLLTGQEGGIFGVSFSPDGTRLATGAGDGTVRVWTVSSCWELLTITIPGRFGRVAFNPDGSQIASGVGDDGMVKIWDTSSGDEVLSLNESGHEDRVESVAFSPDGFRLAIASMDGMASIWDITSGQHLWTLGGHNGGVHDIVFDPDGTHVATASMDGTAKVWDATTGKELLSLDGSGFEKITVTFSPDGTRLATIATSFNNPGILKIWDVSTGEELFNIRDWSNASVAFSPDGTRIATAGGDEVKVWDAATGQETLALRSESGDLISVAFSSNGTRLATASSNSVATVWDAATGQELLVLSDCAPHELSGIAFSPNGKKLAMSGEGAIQIFLVNIEDLVALAESRLTRWFTRDECLRYLRPERCTTPTPTPVSTPHASFDTWECITFNLDDPIASELAVRQAIAYGTDRQLLGDEWAPPYNPVIMNSYLSPDNPFFAGDENLTLYPYDPKRARSILEEAGWVDDNNDGIRERGGIPLQLEYYTTNDIPERLVLAESFTEEMRVIGIQIMVRPVEREDLLGYGKTVRIIAKGTFQLTQAGWTALGPRDLIPTDQFEAGCKDIFHSKCIPSATTDWLGYNISRWRNDEADSFLDNLVTASSFEERYNLLVQLQQLFTSELPYLPLFIGPEP